MIRAPWNERNGRFSRLKAVVFAALFAPALYILIRLVTGALAPKPVTEMIHGAGDWAIRLLLISLAVTPLRRLAQWPKLIAVRRMIGVAAFAYGLAHLSLYVVDQNYNLAHVASEIALRFYLTIGFVTLLGLAALATTSTDAMIRRLGAARWNRLHKIVYALAAVALLHYYLQSKVDVSYPVFFTGLYLMLMFHRALAKRLGLWPAALASVTLAIGATPLVEAAWYALRRHIPFAQVLAANVDPDMFPRPSLFVAAAGLAALFVMLARNWPRASSLAAAE